jgi:hypothetical protein
MPKPKISELLQQLQNEIEQHSLSGDDKEKVEQLVQDIQRDLDEDTFSNELNDSLADTVTEFEASYPRLTAIINDIMVTLSNMGI